MINLINDPEILDRDARVSILNRALNATPFFNLLDFEVVVKTVKESLYAAKIEINKDFYLTNVRGNFGEMHTSTGSFFDVSIYTNLRQKSIYKFGRNNPLPSGFIMNEARYNTVIAAQVFDDRQRESIAFRIPSGDRVIAEIANLQTVGELDNALIVLSGFSITRYPYLDDRLTELINRSLANPVSHYLFRTTIDFEGRKAYNIVNDSFPRLVLGFGVVNSTITKGDISRSTVTVKDTTRELLWNNIAMPIEFLAPRLTCVEDIHQYYLPVEYFLQPFANLQFDINNISPNLPSFPEGYELVMLTRTI